MKDYKEEIRQTRFGCLGSSDATMLAKIDSLGNVPQSAYRRLAVVKGLIEQEETPTTNAMRYGDMIEQCIYEHIASTNPQYQSNPLWESNQYKYDNVRLICHPDFVLEDENTQTIHVYECKCTKFSLNETKRTYRAQLYVEYRLAKERALTLGNKWRVKLYLVHYDTNGLDLDDLSSLEFDTNRLSLCEIRFSAQVFNISNAMEITNNFLSTFDVCDMGENIDSVYLPANVRDEFNAIATTLVEIQEKETKVKEFKEKLYAFMLEKGIKSIKNDVYTITRVDDCEQHTFDSRRYLEDYAKDYPRKYRKLIALYDKVTTKKGHVNIRINKNNNN